MVVEIIKAVRLNLLLASAALFLLGAGIAYYYGRLIEPGRFFIGLGWVWSLQLALHVLYDYFDGTETFTSR